MKSLIVRTCSALLFVTVGSACSSDPSAPVVRVKPPGVAAGTANACALRADSVAVCWGATSKPAAPLVVSSALKFVAITSASGFGCGLTAAGAAYCWGANDQGQLGDGSNDPSSRRGLVIQALGQIARAGSRNAAIRRRTAAPGPLG